MTSDRDGGAAKKPDVGVYVVMAIVIAGVFAGAWFFCDGIRDHQLARMEYEDRMREREVAALERAAAMLSARTQEGE